jgi:tetratricopeptide (TPR) repeat protein
MEGKTSASGNEKAKRPLTTDSRLSLRPQLFELSSFGKEDDARFETQFFEELVSSDPCNEEALMILGSTYTRRGEYEKGLNVDRRLVRLRPADPIVYYNLACSYCLLRHIDESLAALERAISLGYRDVPHLTNDPDLDNLRSDPRYHKLMQRLVGRSASNS